MGGAIQYVYRDGQRLTPWMKHCVDLFSAAFFQMFGLVLYVSSGLRTYQDQVDIFLKRYVTAGNIRGRTVYDTRVWNGVRYYRIDPTGTVAVPGTSNHEIQRNYYGAVDLRDSGKDAGISRPNNPRSNWARANAPRFGLEPEGYNFKEPWHFRLPDIFRAVPVPTPSGGGGSSKTKEVKVKHYFNDDGKALRKGGLDLAPGAGSWLHKDAKAATSKATNIIGGVGEYDFTVHVYAEGKPGDIVDVVLAWDDTKTSGPHSMHFVERVEIGADGTARRNIPFARAAAAGNAVYAQVATPKTNKGTVKITRFATDALLFIAA